MRRHLEMRRVARRLMLAGACLWLASGPAGAEEAHLPFFRAHRDWLLRAFESLERAPLPPDATARAWSFDPFADESAAQRLAAVRASLDTATTLGDLEVFRVALDSLLDDAARAGARLDSLDWTFAAHLRTALEVTLAAPADLDVERVEAWLDGLPVARHELGPEERAALAAGGIFEVVHRVVEPRAQALEVRAWTRGRAEPSSTMLVVDPTPDRLAIVQLHLTDARAPARLVLSTLGGR